MKNVTYYFGIDDCSGFCSTYKEAERSLKNCANNLGWTLISEQQIDDFTWCYHYVRKEMESEIRINACIVAFNSNED